MSDIEADNNDNVSLQRKNPEEETETIPNEAKADNTVPELDLEALHSSLAHRNPNDTLKHNIRPCHVQFTTLIFGHLRTCSWDPGYIRPLVIEACKHLEACSLRLPHIVPTPSCDQETLYIHLQYY